MKKMIHRNYLLFFVILSFNSSAQLPEVWSRNFKPQGLSADRLTKIHADTLGNVYVAGFAGALRGYADAFAMKRNSAGDTLWNYYYNGPGNWDDYAYDMFVDSIGNVYLTGKAANATGGTYDCVTIKLDNSGVQQWATRYTAVGSSNSQGNSLIVNGNGDVYVAGKIKGPTSSQDWLFIKYNSLGVQQWADQFNGTTGNDDEAIQVILAPNGNPTVCGYNGRDIFVKQYTTAGGMAWSDTWTNPTVVGSDKAVGMRFIPNGDLIVGGESGINISNYRDPVAISYSSSGSRQWVCIYTDATTTRDEFVNSVAVDDSGNCYLAGADYQNGLVTRINGNGTLGWRRSWNGPSTVSHDVLRDIVLDDNGGVYTSGSGIYPGPNYFGNGGTDNFILIKYSTQGDSLWTKRISDNNDVSSGIALEIKNGKIYSCGFKGDTADFNQDHYIWILDTAGITEKEWQYNGSGEGIARGEFVRTDAQDNVYCAATCDRKGGYQSGWDIVIIKYDPAGTLLWDRYYSSPGLTNDTLMGFEIDTFGNLILSVSSDTNALSQSYRMSLVKMDANGKFINTLWINGAAQGNSFAKSLLLRNDGSIVLAGIASGIGGFVTYIDDQFTQQWIAKIDSTINTVSSANSLALFSNGDFVMGGYTQVLNDVSTRKGILQRFDINGNRLWSAETDSLNIVDEIKDISVSNLNKVAITGSTGTTCMIETYNGSNGLLQWRSIYNPTTASEYGVKVRFTNFNNVVMLCRGYTGFVPKYVTTQFSSTTGALQWATQLTNAPSTREPLELLIEPSGRVITAGYAVNGSTTNLDFILAGYSSIGTQVFINQYSTAGSKPDQLFSLARDNQGNFIVTGGTADDFLNDYLYHMLTVKYGGSAVGLNEIFESEPVTVWPNPSSTGTFYLIDQQGSSPITKIEVYNLNGQKILVLNQPETEINLTNAPSGCYILRYIRDDTTYGVIKLIR